MKTGLRTAAAAIIAALSAGASVHAEAAAPDQPRALAVFAPDTPDIDVLIDGLRDGVTAHVLSGRGDALAEIAARADGYDSVHVFSHGAPGRVFLGDTVLSGEHLSGTGA